MNINPGSINIFDPSEIKRAFEATAPSERGQFLRSAVGEMSSGLRGISGIVALYDVDPSAFRVGLEAALNDDPGNLTAGRALLWLFIRENDVSNYDRVFDALMCKWSNYNDLFIERLRLLISTGSSEAAAFMGKVHQRVGTGLKGVVLGMQVNLQAQNPGIEITSEPSKALSQAGFFSFLNGTVHGKTEEDRRDLINQIWDIAKRIQTAKTIVIVGNGTSLRGSNLGEVIDSHDCVIRCNFPMIKGHSADVGCKSDLIFFNESLRPNLGGLLSRSEHYLTSMRMGLHPEADFQINAEEALGVDVRSASLPSEARKLIADIAYPRATTGMMAIVILTVFFRRPVTIAGFDFFSNVRDAHYFPGQSGAYLGHELSYEAWYVGVFLPAIYAGSIRRL